jgi:thiol-disulfide isomerase/thioredoxin
MDASRDGPWSTASTRRRALFALATACAAPLSWRAARAAAASTSTWNVRPWPKGRRAPRLELRDLDGQVFSLAAVKGRVVLLNFWASWCEPCRAEIPSLESLAKRYGNEGLSVVAINYQEGEAGIRRFLQGTPFMLPILLDGDGAAARAWTPLVFPSTVVIGRDGRPAFTVVGEADWTSDDAQRSITPLLGSATAPRRPRGGGSSP